MYVGQCPSARTLTRCFSWLAGWLARLESLWGHLTTTEHPLGAPSSPKLIHHSRRGFYYCQSTDRGAAYLYIPSLYFQSVYIRNSQRVLYLHIILMLGGNYSVPTWDHVLSNGNRSNTDDLSGSVGPGSEWSSQFAGWHET